MPLFQYLHKFPVHQTSSYQPNRRLLGGKGANLAEMASLGLPVPPGFTITTDVCAHYFQHGNTLPDGLAEEIHEALEALAQETSRRFGDNTNPLLLSVRSGAQVSMPGMMDTVLNLGLNDHSVESIARETNDPRFAYDSYRRFIQMYADVVMGLDHHTFEDHLETYKLNSGYVLDTDLAADDWMAIVANYKTLVEEEAGEPFPQDPLHQLWGGIEAVFRSWMAPRAITYRALNDIPEAWGTAVNVQVMVFGNRGPDSATGVAFTRNPSTGDPALYGEFLVNAQGEDVVSGIRTPQDLTEAARAQSGSDAPSLEALMPEVFAEFSRICNLLETHYRDMQDVEFTIEQGKLWMLQTRTGKRTIKAALRIAVDMAKEGLISREEAILRINPASLDQLLHPTLDPLAERTLLAKGLPASPGAASGEIALTSEAAQDIKANGRKAILVRLETSPEDIHGMHAAEGVLTARGGMTSHAAVVARGMGKPCVSGASQLRIDTMAGTVSIRDKTLKAGDIVTIDGSSGQVLEGTVALCQPELSDDFETLMSWADDIRQMEVRANAETSSDARSALEFGAEGIGLCRTEHMFFEAERILAMREMILADDAAGRATALDKLLRIQREDFIELFDIMRGKPVTVRLLDPPLHEFLPQENETGSPEIDEVASALNISSDTVKNRMKALHEFNPMLGHRGCRLAISYPEIAIMQTQAIMSAAIEATRKTGAPVELEIMVPLVMDRRELDFVKTHIDDTARMVMADEGLEIPYMIGTMVELPRAALLADEIAQTAEFFSFGTNDLTQTTFGISRDDAAGFLNTYTIKDVLTNDPFISLDRKGVGALIALASEKGRAVRPDIKLGICGEHGGDPASIQFCQELGLHYVSCSPFRVPIARLAAAQATLK